MNDTCESCGSHIITVKEKNILRSECSYCGIPAEGFGNLDIAEDFEGIEE